MPLASAQRAARVAVAVLVAAALLPAGMALGATLARALAGLAGPRHRRAQGTLHLDKSGLRPCRVAGRALGVAGPDARRS